MSEGINIETVAKLADDCARELCANPLREMETTLRKFIIQAMEIGSRSALDTVYEKLEMRR